MGIKNKLRNIFNRSKKEQSGNSDKAVSKTIPETVIKKEIKDFPVKRTQLECYEEKQKKHVCFFKINHQAIAIDIGNTIDQKLKTFTEIGIEDNLYAVYIKPGYDINKAKEIALSVMQKDIYRGKKIKWEFYTRIKDERRKFQRLNLIKLDKQAIIGTLIDDENQNDEPRISLHQSVFALYDSNNAQYFGELADISERGFKLISRIPVRANTEYNLEADFLKIKNIEQKIQFVAECVYVNDTLGNDTYICNFKYTRLDSPGREIVKKIIDLYSKKE